MIKNRVAKHALKTFSLTVLALSLAACGKQAAPPQGGKPQVKVVTLSTQAVALSSELPGRTSVYRVAEVRPQVSSLVQKHLFTGGR